jgi:hypothetical protein
MSVCIAAIAVSEGPGGRRKEIAAMVDRKMASGEFSNEDATTKSDWLSQNWLCMFAGNDISPALPIARRAAELIGWNEGASLEAVSGAMQQSYQEFLSNLCMSQVLGRWKFKSIEEFREKGRKQFGNDVFDMLCDKIERVRVQCTFLVCGIDGIGEPHIFTVSNPGVVENRDTPGYFAIGNGAFAAMSVMSFFKQSVVCSAEETWYHVIAAKLMAESATDVGKEVFYWRLSKGMWKEAPNVSASIFWDVREAWNKGGCPSIPDGIIEKIKGYLEPEKPSESKSGPEKSTQAQ